MILMSRMMSGWLVCIDCYNLLCGWLGVCGVLGGSRCEVIVRSMMVSMLLMMKRVLRFEVVVISAVSGGLMMNLVLDVVLFIVIDECWFLVGIVSVVIFWWCSTCRWGRCC